MSQLSKKSVSCLSCNEELKVAFDKNNSHLKFHEDCVKCGKCKSPLAKKEWCIIKTGIPYCDLDCLPVRRQPKDSRCYFCSERLNGNTKVIKIRGHIYHTSCVKCFECGVKLKPKQSFCVKKDRIVCSSHDSHSVIDKKRFSRTVINGKKKLTLLEKFQHKNYPNSEDRVEISKELNLPEGVVKVWFQNHRSRNKCELKKEEAEDDDE